MPARSPASLRTIAWYQRLLILCVVVQLLMWVGYVVVIGTGLDRDNGEGTILLLIWTAGVGVLGGLLVFLLSLKVSGPITGLLLGLMTVVPCFGLLVMLVASLQATSALREHGVRVGLFGARFGDLADVGSRFDDLGDEEEEGW